MPCVFLGVIMPCALLGILLKCHVLHFSSVRIHTMLPGSLSSYNDWMCSHFFSVNAIFVMGTCITIFFVLLDGERWFE